MTQPVPHYVFPSIIHAHCQAIREANTFRQTKDESPDAARFFSQHPTRGAGFLRVARVMVASKCAAWLGDNTGLLAISSWLPVRVNHDGSPNIIGYRLCAVWSRPMGKHRPFRALVKVWIVLRDSIPPLHREKACLRVRLGRTPPHQHPRPNTHRVSLRIKVSPRPSRESSHNSPRQTAPTNWIQLREMPAPNPLCPNRFRQ